MASTEVGSTRTAASPATSSVAVPARRHHRRALGHGLQHRQAEALPEAGVGHHGGPVVERGQLVGREEAEGPDPARDPGQQGGQVLVPPLGADQHQLHVRPRRGGPWPRPAEGRFFAGLDGAHEQDVGPVQPVAPPHRRPLLVGHRPGATPQGTTRIRSRPIPASSHSTAVASDGHQHQPGVAPGQLEAPAEEPQPVAGGVARARRRKARSCTVTTSGAAGARDGHRGGVDEVDRAGGRLHPRPPQPRATSRTAPGGAGAGAPTGTGGAKAGAGGSGWRAATPHHLDVVPGGQGAGQLEDRGGRAPGDPVPALLEGEGDPHGVSPGLEGDGRAGRPRRQRRPGRAGSGREPCRAVASRTVPRPPLRPRRAGPR